jgi:hypothetical protein
VIVGHGAGRGVPAFIALMTGRSHRPRRPSRRVLLADRFSRVEACESLPVRNRSEHRRRCEQRSQRHPNRRRRPCLVPFQVPCIREDAGHFHVGNHNFDLDFIKTKSRPSRRYSFGHCEAPRFPHSSRRPSAHSGVSQAFHLIEHPIEGICCTGPWPVSATCFIASKRSRRAFGIGVVREASSLPRYCNSSRALKPKKSGVH